ncbi:MAG TPA: hypothetical protein VMF04_02355 [Thermoplasmata archaeon]|nr:hypothetical protein [Thermoplasmata archaeon]
MRKVLFIVGVVLAILGAVLIVVPLIPSASNFTASSADCTGSSCTTAYNIYSASPVIPTYAKLSWSAPTTVYFFAITCTNDVSTSQLDNANSSAQLGADCGTNTTVGNTSGTSGSYSFTIPAGGSLVFFAASSSSVAPTVTATLTGTEPFLGLIVLILGIILLVLGVVLKSKKQKSLAIPSS